MKEWEWEILTSVQSSGSLLMTEITFMLLVLTCFYSLSAVKRWCLEGTEVFTRRWKCHDDEMEQEDGVCKLQPGFIFNRKLSLETEKMETSGCSLKWRWHSVNFYQRQSEVWKLPVEIIRGNSYSFITKRVSNRLKLRFGSTALSSY